MAIIPQKQLFSWQEIEVLGDLERLVLVLQYMPDEALMQLLERMRGLGRDDYPIRGMWNAVLAGIVYQHCSAESLLSELRRNGQLRNVCGLKKAPTSSAFSRFLSKLLDMDAEVSVRWTPMSRHSLLGFKRHRGPPFCFRFAGL